MGGGCGGIGSTAEPPPPDPLTHSVILFDFVFITIVLDFFNRLFAEYHSWNDLNDVWILPCDTTYVSSFSTSSIGVFVAVGGGQGDGGRAGEPPLTHHPPLAGGVLEVSQGTGVRGPRRAWKRND